MQPKYFSVSYDNAGEIGKYKSEGEIRGEEGLLERVDNGEADVFRLEMVSGLPQVRRLIVDTVEAEGDDEESSLDIGDWELVV